MHRYAWDGGPVKIAETLSEGDEIAGFRVIELPGHAPGQIGLFRESDRLALVSDCFYTVDMWGRSCAPHVPAATYNFDTEQARASIRKLAAMEPSAAWPGHAKPVTGDVSASSKWRRRPSERAWPRQRVRARRGELKAPGSDYTDADGNVLTLRGSLTPGARREYAQILAGNPLSQEDAWQRAVELLFERLAQRWVIAGLPIERQRELLGASAGQPRRARVGPPGPARALRRAFPRYPGTLTRGYSLALTAGAFAVWRVPVRIASLPPAATGRARSALIAGSTRNASIPPQFLARGAGRSR